jgi:DNA-3-methyladenine glycosylase I
MTQQLNRCGWQGTLQAMVHYHDTEWGVPVHNDAKHFEFLVLDAFQAGLSWSTIIKKRDAFREVFLGFDVEKVAAMGPDDVERLMGNAAIIRNRSKIEATIRNAKAFIDIQKEFGSFDTFIWQFVNHQTIHNGWTSLSEVPAVTPQAETMSKALKARGFNFVGPTICYAYMQAAGMVNDHTIDCFRYNDLTANK